MPFLKKRIFWIILSISLISVFVSTLWIHHGDESAGEVAGLVDSATLEKELVPSVGELGGDSVEGEPEVAQGTDEAFPSLGVSMATSVALDESENEHGHILEMWKGRIDPPIQDWDETTLGTTVAFALPNGEELAIAIGRFEAFSLGKGVYAGTVEAEAFSEVLFSYVNSAVAGVIRLPSEGVSWEIRNAGEGEQFFELVDLSALGECGVCRLVR